MTSVPAAWLDTIVLGDWLDLIRQLPDESVDLVVTDPAYESMNRWLGIGSTARMGRGRAGTGSDDPEKFFRVIPNSQLPDLVQHIYRVLRPGRHAYIVCDELTERLIYRHAVEAEVFTPTDDMDTPSYRRLVWDKVDQGMGYSYRRRYEFVVFLWKGEKLTRRGLRKGKRPLADLGVPDVLRAKRVPASQALVPTQKPDPLFDLLVFQSSLPGEIAFDPFMGSGTLARAAARQGRRFVGFEVDEAHRALALQSLAGVAYQPDYNPCPLFKGGSRLDKAVAQPGLPGLGPGPRL